jgi:uncharacterized protein (DUF2237 family)
MFKVYLFQIFLIFSYQVINHAKIHNNVLGTKLETCSLSPLTGFTRTGKCETNKYDYGTHLVCAKVTKKFLDYTKSKGNDLSTPTSYFPGLKPGDNWCLCVFRWVQAYRDKVAPPLILNSTHQDTLNYLKRYKLGLKDLKNIGNIFDKRKEKKNFNQN